MATTRQLVEQLAQGAVPLESVVADFQQRVWPPPRIPTELEIHGVVDTPPVDDESVDWIEITPGLTVEQRVALRAAYDQSVQ